MARRNQMDDFMVGGSRGPSANRPDPNAGRRPGDPYIIAQDSRPVGTEGLSQNEIQQFNDFLNVSGRGDKIRNRTNISGRDAAKLARMQFDQFRNLQGGGDYAPSLTPGMTVPGGTIARRPEARGGLGSFFGGGGFLGGILGALGGNAPKTIQASGGSGRRGRGSFNLNTGQTSAMNPNVGRRDVLSRMITERPSDSRPSSRVPAGGITNVFSDLGRNVGSASAIPLSTPVLLSTSPSSTDQTMFGSDIFEEAVGATPEESGTFIMGDRIVPADNAELVYTIEGTTPDEQSYLRAIRDDDLADDYSTGPETRFERAMADRVALLNAAQEAADATELAEINMLMRGRELADRDAGNVALQESIGQAIASAQIRDAERAAANQAVMDAVRDEQNRQADLEEMFIERDLGDMSYMREIEKDIIEPALSSIGSMGISLDGSGRPIMDYMSPTEEAYMRMTDADDVGVYMDPSAQTSEQQLRAYDFGGVPGTGEGITMRPSDVLGAASGMAPPSSYGTYREFNREGMPYVSRRALNTREDLGRMMDEMMNRRLGYAPNIAQGI